MNCQKKIKMKKNFVIIVLSLFNSLMYSQRICENTKELVSLSDNINVYVYQEVGNKQAFYYVPIEIQIANKKGKSEYSFLEYGKGTPSGAIFHCLLTWGLDKKQLRELRQYVQKKYGEQAQVLGGVHLEKVNNQLFISSTKPLGRILRNSLKSKGTLPTMSGSKMAISFKLNKEEARLVKQAIKKPEKFRGVNFKMNYYLTIYTCGFGVKTAKRTSIQLQGKLNKWF